jgi:hypothetical protein
LKSLSNFSDLDRISPRRVPEETVGSPSISTFLVSRDLDTSDIFSLPPEQKNVSSSKINKAIGDKSKNAPPLTPGSIKLDSEKMRVPMWFWSTVLYIAVIPTVIGANYLYQVISSTALTLSTATEKIAYLENKINDIQRAPAEKKNPSVIDYPVGAVSSFPIPLPLPLPLPIQASSPAIKENSPLRVLQPKIKIPIVVDSKSDDKKIEKDDVPEPGQFVYMTEEKPIPPSNFKLIGEK